jgi:hypothetical protein
LKNHFLISDQHHYCYKCAKVYSSAKALQEHIERDAKTHNYCNVCNVKFKSREHLDLHIKQNPEAHFYCRKCDTILQSRNDLKIHMSNSDEDFSAKKLLKEHYISSDVHYYCHTCDMLFSSAEALHEHIQEKMELHHYCSVCKRMFQKEQELSLHQIQCSGDLWYCPRCKITVEDNDTIYQHIRTNENHHLCSRCHRDFPRKEDLDVHLLTQHDLLPKSTQHFEHVANGDLQVGSQTQNGSACINDE